MLFQQKTRQYARSEALQVTEIPWWKSLGHVLHFCFHIYRTLGAQNSIAGLTGRH